MWPLVNQLALIVSLDSILPGLISGQLQCLCSRIPGINFIFHDFSMTIFLPMLFHDCGNPGHTTYVNVRKGQ